MANRSAWKYAATAVIAFLASCRPAPTPTSTSKQSADDVLRVITWNIQKCEGGIDAIAKQLASLNADVVCLQEVLQPRAGSGHPDQARWLAEKLGMHVFAAGGELDDRRDQSIAILTRPPLEETETLTAIPGRNYGVTGVIPWRGARLRIISVHLAGTWKPEWEHVAKTSQDRAADWDDLLKRVASWSGPTVLAGDFNTLRNDSHFETLSRTLRLVSPAEATFPSVSPAVGIDHVAISAELETVETAVVDCVISDHRPVFCAVKSSARW